MSRPMNMLRTRRKDCNVKPNRRLDRKSSRGMLFENEELRLKTININAEVESRQFDIKKLKRENEMLKKGLWYLRDEYDKLERLIKDKKIDFSSSSSTSTSDSESCNSCSEESEEVETAQNIKNVQKTNLRNIQDQFEQLSVVTEETSAENSELSCNRGSVNKDIGWDENILPPDQSYPIYENVHIPKVMPGNFFTPIKPDDNYNQAEEKLIYPQMYSNIEENENIEIPPENYQHNPNCEHFINQENVQNNTNFYQNLVLVPQNGSTQTQAKTMEKSLSDLIVTIDNQNFKQSASFGNNTSSQSTFSNGGNLEELLNDIESISQDILRISNLQRGVNNHVILPQEMQESAMQQNDATSSNQLEESQSGEYKSELSVVLVPNPMPIITLDKYKNIQRSFENVNSKPIEDLSVSDQDLCLIPPPPPLPTLHIPEKFQSQTAPILNVGNTPSETDKNPFFFGNFKDNYVNGNLFYSTDVYSQDKKDEEKSKIDGKFGSKSNLIDVNSSELISSENEENLKAKTASAEDKKQNQGKEKKENMSLRKKVSIHFKGKNKMFNSDSSIQKISEKKPSLFDIKFNDKDNKDKSKFVRQKTPSIDSKKSTTETSNQEQKTSSSDSKGSIDKKSNKKDQNEKKPKKSISVSPDRSKHVHVAEEGGVRKHKKHKKGDKSKLRRQSVLLEPRSFRERSFSVCTDRSLEHRLGLGVGFGSSFLYDDFSERERTNSLSSCDTAEHVRKMSALSNIPLSGKVPWCGCWGNGCL